VHGLTKVLQKLLCVAPAIYSGCNYQPLANSYIYK